MTIMRMFCISVVPSLPPASDFSYRAIRFPNRNRQRRIRYGRLAKSHPEQLRGFITADFLDDGEVFPKGVLPARDAARAALIKWEAVK